jgi:hypothetical protein
MTSAILEAAKVGVVHESNIAGVGALDDDDIVFVQVLSLVNELHGGLGLYIADGQGYHDDFTVCGIGLIP